MPPARSAAAASRPGSRRASGPAAAPSRPRLTVRTPISRVRWDRLGRASLLVVFAVVIGLYVQHALSYLATRSQANQQRALVQSLRRSNAELARQVQTLNDPAAVVLDARRLGMVYPGEHPYVITGLPGH